MKKFLVFMLIVVIPLMFLSGSKASVRKISEGIDLNTSSPLKVIVELKDLPLSSYQKTFRYKIMRIINKSVSRSYERKLISKQKMAFSVAVKKNNGSFGFSFTYVFNGFSCTINSDGVKALAKLRDVKKIYPDKKEYLLRQKADQVIGVYKVRKLKDPFGRYLTGKGIVVGIVDTGVDYNDSELGGGGFPNSKVIGGYDFADNDPDPMDKDGHGTHVAGIIAGTKYGVAPDAKIRAYRVFGTNASSTSESLIVKGIDQAVKDRCNIINISIGTTGGMGNGSDPESTAVENAVSGGVVVVAAAGNWGSRSDVLPFPFGSPGSNKDAIGVGASDDSEHPIIYAGNKQILGNYASNSPMFNDGSYSIVYCDYGRKEDIKNINVSGKVALVKRGLIYFGDKDLNLKSAGAIGVICYNNVPGLPQIKLESQVNPNAKNYIPFLFISNSQGMLLKKIITQSNQVSIKNKFGLGLMANFSSEGPTKDFCFKPDLVAPGVNISSTVLNNKIESWSGTSMAAPFVSGASALLLQDKPDLKPDEVKALLMNTSTILKNPDSGMPFTPLLQGAGRVNIYDAVMSNVVITPPSVIFGSGETSVTKQFTAKNFSDNVLLLSVTEKTFSPDSISVDFPKNVVVPPHGSYTFSIKFSAPLETPSDVYGAVFFSGGGSDLHIPFIYIPKFNVPKPLSGVYLTKDSVAAGSSTYLNFSVNVGTEDKDEDTVFTENVADEVKAELFDSSGQLVKILFDRSPVYIGEYSVPIETVSRDGAYLLANGVYFYKVSYIETNQSSSSGSPYVVKAQRSGSFTVKGAPKNKIFISSENGETLLMKKGTSFNVYLSISLNKPIMNLNFTVGFNPYLLSLTHSRVLINDVKFNYSVSGGKLYGTLSGDLGKSGNLVVFTFKSISEGSDILDLPSVSYYPAEQKVLVSGKYFEVSKNPYPYDINGDKVVNNADLSIFEKSFGLNEYDKDFNAKCDFNGDKKVDSTDFFILMRHFGERYP